MSNYLKVEMLQSGAVLGTDALTSSLTTDTTGATPATYANLTVAAGDLVVKDSADVVKGLAQPIKLTVVIGGGQTTIGGTGGQINVIEAGEGLVAGDKIDILAAKLGGSSTQAQITIQASDLYSGTGTLNEAVRYIPCDNAMYIEPVSATSAEIIQMVDADKYTFVFGNPFSSESSLAGQMSNKVSSLLQNPLSQKELDLGIKPVSIVLTT